MLILKITYPDEGNFPGFFGFRVEGEDFIWLQINQKVEETDEIISATGWFERHGVEACEDQVATEWRIHHLEMLSFVTKERCAQSKIYKFEQTRSLFSIISQAYVIWLEIVIDLAYRMKFLKNVEKLNPDLIYLQSVQFVISKVIL